MRSNVSGVGFYNSEPRISRGFGRGNPRPYRSSQPPPSPQPAQKGDLFVEAGRLAVEYLISHGLLSQNVLPDKLENGTLKNSNGGPHDNRHSQEREPNDQEMGFSRSYSKERRNYGGPRSFSSDSSRENERVGSLPEKITSSHNMEVDYDKYPKDNSKEEISEIPVESANKDERHSDEQHEIEMTFSPQEKGFEEHSELTGQTKEEAEEDKTPIKNSENNNEGLTQEKINLMKVHSFLTDKSSESEPLLISDMKTGDSGMDDKICGSSPSSDFGNAGELDHVHAINQLGPVESPSFTDKGFSLDRESSGIPNSEIGISIAEDRGEKRALEDDHTTEMPKKPKQQWLSVAQSEECLQLPHVSDKKPTFVGKKDANIFNESSMDDVDEKQLHPSSYKIFDLNLMEASDIHENHGVSSLLYRSLSAPKKAQIDVDLSMSDNCSFSREYNDSVYARKDVEIIDLESPSTEEDKKPKLSSKNAEAGITSIENITDSLEHQNDNPDGQDGYGFMISELLGNDAPNCSTAQPDINSLQNDMGLHHGEGMFSEDDPIYMSLGEIPLTGLLQDWEQPTQERNPFDL